MIALRACLERAARGNTADDDSYAPEVVLSRRRHPCSRAPLTGCSLRYLAASREFDRMLSAVRFKIIGAETARGKCSVWLASCDSGSPCVLALDRDLVAESDA